MRCSATVVPHGVVGATVADATVTDEPAVGGGSCMARMVCMVCVACMACMACMAWVVCVDRTSKAPYFLVSLSTALIVDWSTDARASRISRARPGLFESAACWAMSIMTRYARSALVPPLEDVPRRWGSPWNFLKQLMVCVEMLLRANLKSQRWRSRRMSEKRLLRSCNCELAVDQSN